MLITKIIIHLEIHCSFQFFIVWQQWVDLLLRNIYQICGVQNIVNIQISTSFITIAKFPLCFTRKQTSQKGKSIFCKYFLNIFYISVVGCTCSHVTFRYIRFFALSNVENLVSLKILVRITNLSRSIITTSENSEYNFRIFFVFQKEANTLGKICIFLILKKQIKICRYASNKLLAKQKQDVNLFFCREKWVGLLLTKICD
eukprot:TRINITY_DN1493_c0_g4_i2.p2 TRINITY_DN1493_c0_g4~~TRINITY_DN1493_c0_g4_i2.p2  ORF type:complete len:201 (-),score=-13.64 TRINITY_DN1493_c0_g4_i2:281-883(-)